MAAAKQTVQVVAPPEPPAGNGAVSGAFLAYFPSGAPAGVGGGAAAGGAAASARPPNTRFSVYRRNTAAQARQQLMLVGHTEAVDYVGTNFGGDAAAAAPCQYALGVVDAAAGTLTFVPLAGAKVLRMDASVRGLDYGAPEWQQDDAAETPAGRAAARKRLDDTFATEKRRRQQARLQTARVVAPDALPAVSDMQAYIASTVKNELTADEQAARVALRRNIPPHAPDATRAADAYPMERLVDVRVLDDLPWRPLMKACKSSKARAALTAGEDGCVAPHAYVLSKLDLLAMPGDAAEREALAKALAYLSLLLRLHAAPREVDDDWISALGAPATVVSHLLSRFTESNGPVGGASGSQGGKPPRHGRPSHLRDLLMATVLVVALTVDNFSLEYDDLAKALQVEAVKLVKHFTELGCRIKRTGGTARAELMSDPAAGATLATFLPDTHTRAKAGPKRG